LQALEILYSSLRNSLNLSNFSLFNGFVNPSAA
jgi:hypothetical protein